MEMQKSVIFVKKNLKINDWKIEKIVPVEKEGTRIGKNGWEITKNIS